MKNQFPDHVIGIPVSSVSYTVEKSAEEPTSVSETASPYFISTPSKESLRSKQYRVDTLIDWINKLGKKADSFTHGVREHVRLGPKVSATVKGKLRLGARFLQKGGVEKLFKQIFSVREGEKLLNASQCYLSTTAGPIAGILFISTENVAFCSERSVTFTLPTQELIRTPYKVMIPLTKIKGANQSENVNNPNQKYIQVVTVDKFEFWFMGFLIYQKAFKYIQQAISQS
ncbi:putative GEM-like protein 8 isoform X1 [Telopea speciosissima]|uniref:putative GEM-like protein 8 isoform X1 n=1 Tax=Telopea speciosissima TaxID=54955 RepID=UPI001CC38CCD|nr:putative GEM-like protein 8 isoform X1 [Telopea speciosissima]XP_043716736.1 putative GEM-like protein 8 isoform X1 [Telopea speciosissima]